MKLLNSFLFLSSLFVVILSSHSDENISRGSRSSVENSNNQKNENSLARRLNRIISEQDSSNENSQSSNIQRRLANSFFGGIGFNSGDSLKILNYFNYLRSELANGRVEPFNNTAANMQELQWDMGVASVANTRASECGVYNDDSTFDLLKAEGYSLRSYASMSRYSSPASDWDIKYVKDEILTKWWNDKSNSGCSAPKWSNCSDFQQLAWAQTTRVGCSINRNCKSKSPYRYDVYFTCYFGEKDGSGAPYIEGSVCSDCKSGQVCTNGLCAQCPKTGPEMGVSVDYYFEPIPNSNVDLYTKALIKAIPCLEIIHVENKNLQVVTNSGKSYDYFSVDLWFPELLGRRITSFSSYKNAIYAEAVKFSL